MLHRTASRLSTLTLLAICTLSACDHKVATDPLLVTDPSLAFDPSVGGGGKGKGKGGNSTAEQPAMTLMPTAVSLTVGQQHTFAVTYWDTRGRVISDDRLTYYGCRKVAETDPDCWSVVSILPLMPYAREAQVTGKAPGTVVVYATDGVSNWVTSTVTVQ